MKGIIFAALLALNGSSALAAPDAQSMQRWNEHRITAQKEYVEQEKGKLDKDLTTLIENSANGWACYDPDRPDPFTDVDQNTYAIPVKSTSAKGDSRSGAIFYNDSQVTYAREQFEAKGWYVTLKESGTNKYDWITTYFVVHLKQQTKEGEK